MKGVKRKLAYYTVYWDKNPFGGISQPYMVPTAYEMEDGGHLFMPTSNSSNPLFSMATIGDKERVMNALEWLHNQMTNDPQSELTITDVVYL